MLQGRAPAYLGVLTSAPFLAAVFAQPRDTAAVGAVALVAAVAYGAYAGIATTQTQGVRLAFLVLATVAAVASAAVRSARDTALRALTNVAEVAQSAILRPVPAAAGSLVFAVRYSSASMLARVGGDFYDVVETPYGVRLVLGDVRGKGLDAVWLAAAVLRCFREAAHTAGRSWSTSPER